MAPMAWAKEPGHEVEALLLSCMDFRLMHAVDTWMDGKGLREDYDHVVLAGSSLGATKPPHRAWTRTFWDHLDLAVDLHSVERVVVLDHRDCGAYKLILGEDFKLDPPRELLVHTKYLHKLRDQIVKHQPDLEVELALMSLDGTVVPIT